MGEKLQPQLRFPGFEGDWERFNLKDIAKFSKGKNISKSEVETNGKYECIRYGELYTKYNEVIDFVYSRTNLEAKNLVFSEANDIIIPASGESAIDIATASCVIRKGIALGGDLNIIKTKENGVFLSYYLNSSKKHEIAKKSQGISVIHIYGDHLKSLSINLPSLSEQQKIADYLSTIDAKINLLGEKKTELSRYKKAMMQKLFSREIRFKDENGTDFPDWKEKRLGEIGDVVSGLTYSPNDITEKGVLVLRSSNIKGNSLSFYDNVFVKVDKYNKTELKDILLCVRNGSKNLIGKSALINQSATGVAFGAFMTIYRSSNNLFIFHWMQTPIFKKYVHKNLGATINSINGNDLKSFVISIPTSKVEQQKIADFLSAIDKSIDNVQEQIKQMQAFKKAMLQQMFV